MVPPAPARLSMMNAMPLVSVSFCVIVRAPASAGPPAANGTTSRMGFAGYDCARAADAASAAMQSAGMVTFNDMLLLVSCAVGFAHPANRVYPPGIVPGGN